MASENKETPEIRDAPATREDTELLEHGLPAEVWTMILQYATNGYDLNRTIYAARRSCRIFNRVLSDMAIPTRRTLFKKDGRTLSYARDDARTRYRSYHTHAKSSTVSDLPSHFTEVVFYDYGVPRNTPEPLWTGVQYKSLKVETAYRYVPGAAEGDGTKTYVSRVSVEVEDLRLAERHAHAKCAWSFEPPASDSEPALDHTMLRYGTWDGEHFPRFWCRMGSSYTDEDREREEAEGKKAVEEWSAQNGFRERVPYSLMILPTRAVGMEIVIDTKGNYIARWEHICESRTRINECVNRTNDPHLGNVISIEGHGVREKNAEPGDDAFLCIEGRRPSRGTNGDIVLDCPVFLDATACATRVRLSVAGDPFLGEISKQRITKTVEPSIATFNAFMEHLFREVFTDPENTVTTN